ncbi:MAG: transglutaminase-like cysteine peptidase [Rhodospirillales bacterium]|nr:transglutaminase-like cysteine peptidase [Rhodospirillales bacterium]
MAFADGSKTWFAKAAVAVLAVALVTSALVVTTPTHAAKAKPTASFFNSKEVRSKNMKPFKKWTAAVKRYSSEKGTAKKTKGSCKSKKFNKCHYETWIKFLVSIKKKDKLTQIKAVNKFMNKSRYITDKNNWGKKDFWASPGEFMARFGDCEDFAIAKFMSLRLLGFKNSEIRVVAVKDLNLKVGHAILVAFVDGKTYVLDNQIKQVIAAERVRHYQPVFSINTKYWWRHST